MKPRPPWELVPMTEDHGKQICTWQYGSMYEILNWPSWDKLYAEQEEFADPNIRREQFYSVIAQADGDLMGFVQFFPLVGTTRLGLGLRPDLCDLGWGVDLVRLAVHHAAQLYPDKEIDLEVLTWNERAIKTYLKAGFEWTDTYIRPTPKGLSEFHCMVFKSNKRY